MACAEMGGTDMSVTAPEQAILAGPVREVGFQKPSSYLPQKKSILNVDLEPELTTEI
jgi:hypothetical protein